MEATIEAVLLDLDETILFDHDANEMAFAATAAQVAGEGIAPARLVDAIRAEAAALWAEGPDPAWADDIGTSEVEGLRSVFAGDDPHMTALRAWGPGFRHESWRRALRRCGIEDDTLAAELDRRFGEERAATNPFIEGAEVALDRLAERYRLAIVTNGLPDVQREKLVRVGLMDRFEAVVVSGEVGCGKPNPRIYDETLRQLDLPPTACVMVGDNLAKDVVGAQAVGIRGVWIACGRPVPAVDAAPWLVVDSLAELPERLGSLG